MRGREEEGRDRDWRRSRVTEQEATRAKKIAEAERRRS
jgi:hypothetical protein